MTKVNPKNSQPTEEEFTEDFELIDDDFDNLELVEDDLEEVYLAFVDPLDDVPQEYIEATVRGALEEYTFEDILTENELSDAEALGILFELGYVGLPEVITDNDSEEGFEEV